MIGKIPSQEEVKTEISGAIPHGALSEMQTQGSFKHAARVSEYLFGRDGGFGVIFEFIQALHLADRSAEGFAVNPASVILNAVINARRSWLEPRALTANRESAVSNIQSALAELVRLPVAGLRAHERESAELHQIQIISDELETLRSIVISERGKRQEGKQ